MDSLTLPDKQVMRSLAEVIINNPDTAEILLSMVEGKAVDFLSKIKPILSILENRLLYTRKEYLSAIKRSLKELDCEDTIIIFNNVLSNFSIKDKQPRAGEWWMCHLKQGAWNRFCVVYRPTDDLWDLPYERLGVKWNQEDVTPKYRMIEEK